jgi:hypothetical protein
LHHRPRFNDAVIDDSETLTLRVTVIGGIRYADDYRVLNGVN